MPPPTDAAVFATTLERLRDLPGLPEESLQDLMALANLYGDAQLEIERLVSQKVYLGGEVERLTEFRANLAADADRLTRDRDGLVAAHADCPTHLARALRERDEARNALAMIEGADTGEIDVKLLARVGRGAG